METKHTKGIWQVAMSANQKTCVWVGGSRICTVDEFPHEGSVNNALLISAAPDLLAACIKLLEQNLNDFDFESEGEFSPAEIAAQEAIGKALGMLR